MRWGACCVVLVLAFVGAVARADDGDGPGAPLPPGPETPAPAETETGEDPTDPGWLALDPNLLPSRQGLGTVETGQHVNLRLGPRTTASFEGAWWQNEDGALPAIDVPGLGWRGGMRLSHDFGFARLEVGGALADIEGPYGRGRYVDVGVSLRRTWKVSRWTSLWLALGFGGRWWLGDAPPGELDSSGLTLTFGGTF